MQTQKNDAVIYCNPVMWNDSNVELSPVLINNEPHFIAVEICELLDIHNASDAMNRLDSDEKLTSVITRSGQQRSVNLVNESGFYHLIFLSRKPNAAKIRKWVTSEVLPQLRRTGRYELKPASAPRPTVRRGELINAEILNLLWLIGESLEQGDMKAVALELGVSRQTVSRVLGGYQRNSRVLMALYRVARTRREEGLLYYAPEVMSRRLLGENVPIPAGNTMPAVKIDGRHGLVGNQNARKHKVMSDGNLKRV